MLLAKNKHDSDSRVFVYPHLLGSEGYFKAEYKKFPGGITHCDCVSFVNVFAFSTSVHSHVWYYVRSVFPK